MTIRDCKKIQNELSAYLDEMVSSKQAWEIGEHLKTCAVCSEVADQLEKTTKLLATLPQRDLSPNFEAALAQRLAEQALTPKKASVWQQFFALPRVKPLFATGIAALAVIPIAIVTLRARPAIVPPESIGVAKASALEEATEEHQSASSDEAFGDASGILIASAEDRN
jgi:hypothetical protein